MRSLSFASIRWYFSHFNENENAFNGTHCASMRFRKLFGTQKPLVYLFVTPDIHRHSPLNHQPPPRIQSCKHFLRIVRKPYCCGLPQVQFFVLNCTYTKWWLFCGIKRDFFANFSMRMIITIINNCTGFPIFFLPHLLWNVHSPCHQSIPIKREKCILFFRHRRPETYT